MPASTKDRPQRVGKLRPVEGDIREWKLPGIDEKFVQDPLTFFEKTEFFGIVSQALERAISSGYDLRGLIMLLGADEKALDKMLEGDGQQAIDSFGNMLGDVVGLLMRVLTIAPGLMEDVYLLILSVPVEKRLAVREALRQIDDDTGFGIFEAFGQQNTETLRDFFVRWREQLGKMVETIRAKEEPTEDS